MNLVLMFIKELRIFYLKMRASRYLLKSYKLRDQDNRIKELDDAQAGYQAHLQKVVELDSLLINYLKVYGVNRYAN